MGNAGTTRGVSRRCSMASTRVPASPPRAEITGFGAASAGCSWGGEGSSAVAVSGGGASAALSGSDIAATTAGAGACGVGSAGDGMRFSAGCLLRADVGAGAAAIAGAMGGGARVSMSTVSSAGFAAGELGVSAAGVPGAGRTPAANGGCVDAAWSRTCTSAACARRSRHGRSRPGQPGASPPSCRLSNSPCTTNETSTAPASPWRRTAKRQARRHRGTASRCRRSDGGGGTERDARNARRSDATEDPTDFPIRPALCTPLYRAR